MITIENAKVLPIKVTGLLLTWDYSKSVRPREDFTYTIQRGYSPDGEYLSIYDLDGYETNYLDNELNRRLWKQTYYRFKTTDSVNAKTWLSKPISVGKDPDLIALEIVRRNDVMLQNKTYGTGVPLVCLIRKYDGVKCDCYDENKQRLIRSNCTKCYGTRVVHGFSKPILLWGNISPDNKTSPVTEIGERGNLQLRIFVSNYPILSPKDVLLDPQTGRAYLIEDISVTQKRGFIIHQVLTVSYINKPDPIYTLRQEPKYIKESTFCG